MTHPPSTTPPPDAETTAETLPSMLSCTRRGFIRGALVGVGALWTGLTLYPILQYLASQGAQDEAEQVSSVTLGKPDEFAPNSAKNFKFGSQPALVYRDAQGEFHAYSAVCTHLGCTVQYQPAKQNLFCACHGGIYDASSGKNIAGPPPKPLTPLAVAVVNGQVVVSRA